MLKVEQIEELKPGDKITIEVPKQPKMETVFVENTEDGHTIVKWMKNNQRFKTSLVAKYGKLPSQKEEKPAEPETTPELPLDEKPAKKNKKGRK